MPRYVRKAVIGIAGGALEHLDKLSVGLAQHLVDYRLVNGGHPIDIHTLRGLALRQRRPRRLLRRLHSHIASAVNLR
jgi:hypothetical protein